MDTTQTSSVDNQKPSRNWVFTHNNYTPEDVLHIKGIDCKYLCFGYEEAPTTGTPHLQGFICFPNAVRFRTIKSLFPPNLSYCCQMKGRLEDNDLYCKKSNDWFEKGVAPISNKQNGLEEKQRWRDIYRDIKNGDLEALAEREPKFFVTQRRTIDYIYNRDYVEPKLPPPNITLRCWQLQLIKVLNGPPDDRKIYFVIDEKGGGGKTTFAEYIESTFDGVTNFGVGKSVDVLYHASKCFPKIALFDFVRSQEGFYPWAAVESIKNGRFLSTKYDTKQVQKPRPHVIVFMNQDLEPGRLSVDRVVKIFINL